MRFVDGFFGSFRIMRSFLFEPADWIDEFRNNPETLVFGFGGSGSFPEHISLRFTVMLAIRTRNRSTYQLKIYLTRSSSLEERELRLDDDSDDSRKFFSLSSIAANADSVEST